MRKRRQHKIWFWVSGLLLTWLMFVTPGVKAAPPPEFAEFEQNVTVNAERNEDKIKSLIQQSGLAFKVRLGEDKREYIFLLDTGAGTCVIDSRLAKELALPELMEADGCDSGGNIAKVKIYQTKSLTVGAMTVNNLPIAGIDMQFLRTTYGVPIDGMIGYNFLKHFAVTLDYQHNQLVLSRKRQSQPETGAIMAKVKSEDYAVTVPVSIDGMVFNPLIDTGAMRDTIDAPNALLEKCKEKRYSKGSMSSGAFGPWTQNIKARAYVTVGDYDFTKAVVDSSAQPVLGHEFLSQFKVVIDYPGRKAWLIPNGKITLPENDYSVGLVFERNEQGILVITGAWQGASADLAGIRSGDKIIMINGIKTPDQTDDYWRNLMYDPAVSSLELVVENPEGVRIVTLEKENLFPPYRKEHSQTGGVFFTAEGTV